MRGGPGTAGLEPVRRFSPRTGIKSRTICGEQQGRDRTTGPTTTSPDRRQIPDGRCGARSAPRGGRLNAPPRGGGLRPVWTPSAHAPRRGARRVAGARRTHGTARVHVSANRPSVACGLRHRVKGDQRRVVVAASRDDADGTPAETMVQRPPCIEFPRFTRRSEKSSRDRAGDNRTSQGAHTPHPNGENAKNGHE